MDMIMYILNLKGSILSIECISAGDLGASPACIGKLFKERQYDVIIICWLKSYLLYLGICALPPKTMTIMEMIALEAKK